MQQRTRAVSEVAAALGTALLYLAVRLQPLGNADLLWQIATGDRILATRSLVHTDLFSAAFRGAPIHDHEGFSEAALAWLHRLGGFPLLWWIGLFVAIALGLLAHAAAARVTEGAGARVVAAAIVVTAIAPRLEPRAEWVAFVAIAVAHALRRDIARGEWRRYAPIAIAALAAPFHAFSLLVVAVPLAHAAEGLLLRRDDVRRDLAVAAAIPIAVHLVAPHVIPSYAAHLRGPTLLEHVIEYYDPLHYVIASGDPAPLIAIAASLIAVVGLVARERVGRAMRADAILVAVFALPALIRVRFTALPLLAMLPWVVGGLAAFFDRLLSRTTVVVRGASLALVVALSITYVTRFVGFEPVVGFDWGTQPIEAVAWLHDHRPNARLFHPLNFGAYLIYAGYPPRGVVIDPRGATLYPDPYVRAYYDALARDAEFATYLDQNGFDTVLLARRHKGTANVRARLYADSRWRVGWEDRVSIVFVRR